MSATIETAETRLAALGVVLPAVPAPAGNYAHAVRSANMLYLAGHVPLRPDGSVVLGRLGESLDLAQGVEAARYAAAAALSTIRTEVGSLDRVRQIVRLFGTVNATPGFLQHTQVINGASDLLTDIFGERGRHARLAVGVSSLPFNIALEVELTVEIDG